MFSITKNTGYKRETVDIVDEFYDISFIVEQFLLVSPVSQNNI